MAHLTQLEIANWIAVYVAVGLCCAISMTLAVAVLVTELYKERAWSHISNARAAILFVPKTWWRWQKLYLLSTPVTLGITGWFAATLSWG